MTSTRRRCCVPGSSDMFVSAEWNPKGQRLGLYGFGASAHIVLQFAKHLGNEVYVFTRGEAHRALALK